MNAGEINFFAGQSGSDMSATGFETGTNSLPAIVNPPSPLSVVSGSVILLLCCNISLNSSFKSFCHCKYRIEIKREQQQPQQHRPIPDPLSASVEMAINHPPPKRAKIYPQDRGETRNHPSIPTPIQLPPHPLHVSPCPPVLIFAKQENEEVFHPLHLVPPSLVGLAVAVSSRSCDTLTKLYRLRYKTSTNWRRRIFATSSNGAGKGN